MRSSEIRDSEGKWLRSSVFKVSGDKFEKDGYYCSHSEGSKEYFDFWNTELDRCINGMVAGGQKITGNHYFYLNYSQIDAGSKVTEEDIDEDGFVDEKSFRFPDFWDWDYEYFWWLEIARFGVLSKYSQAREMLTEDEIARLKDMSPEEKDRLKEEVVYNRLGLRLRTRVDCLNGGKNFIVAKARRKGFSYKNTALMVNTYNTRRNKQCVFGVAQTDLGDAGMDMVNNYLSFLNENTAWGKRREYSDTKSKKRASFKKQDNEKGTVVESGYKSEIILSSFMNNSEATRGKSPYYMLYEEAGTFTNLKEVWAAASPSMENHGKMVGMSIIFGTGGRTASKNGEFADMFYNPDNFNLMPFENIWDDNRLGTYCGFFFPADWDYYVDGNGNSDTDRARAKIIGERERMLSGSMSMGDYQKKIIEFPLCPRESFMVIGKKVFADVADKLEMQLNYVISENLMLKRGTCVKLRYSDNGNSVEAKPIMDGSAEPIIHYQKVPDNVKGCVIIYEYPVNDPPFGLYKIGYDPYAQEHSTTDSLSAIFVYKGIMRGDSIRNVIVAEYIGRPDTADESDEIALKLAILYNTEVMYENNVPHTKSYFERKHRLNRLALQPDRVISKNIKNSSVSRKFGCHLDGKMKTAGEEYLREYLKNVIDYDENGNEVTTIDYIYSIGLLEELIAYYRDGNFDRVCAMFQIMFQIQEEEIDKEYDNEPEMNRINEIMNLKMFERRRKWVS